MADVRLLGLVEVKAAYEPADGEEMEAGAKMGRRFEMLAYTGDKVNIGGFGEVIFDIEGMDCERQTIPALMEHDPTKIVGVTDEIMKGADMVAACGEIYEDEDAGAKVARLSDRRFPWQASVGLDVRDIEELSIGHATIVNGREVTGPILIARSTILKEVSFVPLGADANTSAVALSGAASLQEITRRPEMAPEETKSEATRIKEIRAAFKNDPEFALDQIEKGASVVEAKAAYADVLAAKLEEKNDEIAKAKEAAANPPVPTHYAEASGTPQVDAVERWNELVNAQLSAGRNRWDAVRNAAKSNPDAHAAFLARVNSK